MALQIREEEKNHFCKTVLQGYPSILNIFMKISTWSINLDNFLLKIERFLNLFGSNFAS